MFPPIFEIAAASSAVTGLIGTDPVRLWPFSEAPERETPPYAVWQLIYGAPENCLAGDPDTDSFGTQVDCYATTATAARQAAQALRDAFQNRAYVVSWNGEFKDVPTGLFRYSFTVEWLTARPAS